MMIIALNGQLCEAKQAKVSVYDHGFLYGMGLFETFRTYHGKSFLLNEHLVRLQQSCRELGMEWSANTTELELLISQLLEANGVQDGYIRLAVSAGEGPVGLPGDLYSRVNTIIYIKELPVVSPELYVQGKPLQKLRLRRNTPEGMTRLKSFHFMNNILAKRELSSYPWAGQAEGLFFNEQGYVAEGIVSNVFFVRDGRCYTPAIETGILAGITRDYVMKLCRQSGIQTHEGLYTWEDLLRADELFITNSIQEIVPISILLDEQGRSHVVGQGQVGHMTLQLLDDYREHTGGTYG